MSATSTAVAKQFDADLIDVPGYGRAGRPPWADFDWRPYIHTATIADRKVTYVAMGDRSSPPVVLLHGLAGSWQNWIENIQALAEDFFVIAPDLPGFGGSELPVEPVSIELYAQTIASLLDELGIESAKVIGNSMGGQTAAQMALDFPDRTGKMILVSPAGYSTSAMPPLLGRGAPMLGMAFPGVPRTRRFVSTRPGLRKIALALVTAHPERLRPELAYELVGNDKRVGFVAAAQALLAHDFRPRLVDIGCPTLIVWGAKDRLVTSRDAARFAKRIVGSKKIVIRDTGHMAMLEHPEWFNRTAREFLLA